MRPVVPCKNCDDRTIGCHASCDRYKGFRGALDGHNREARRALGKREAPFIRGGSIISDHYDVCREELMPRAGSPHDE